MPACYSTVIDVHVPVALCTVYIAASAFAIETPFSFITLCMGAWSMAGLLGQPLEYLLS